MKTAVRIKQALADALRQKMREEKLTIKGTAARARMDRNAIKRLLDARNTSVTLRTMASAADALGLKLTLIAKPMSLDQLANMAQALVDAPTEKEANTLKEQILAGFYGERIPAHAKTDRGTP